MPSYGFCLGASNISGVKLEKVNNDVKIIDFFSVSHEGNPKGTFKKILSDRKIESDDYVMVTGRKLKKDIDMPSVSEAEAVETAYLFLKDKYPNISSIVSGGGETFFCYVLNEDGKITTVHTGNKCASGTGEFYVQQLKRMGLDYTSAEDIADTDNPYAVADRCSVFCKSDCTHALNKGIHKGKVVAGLANMMANKVFELIHQEKAQSSNVLLIGGIARNKTLGKFLKQKKDNIFIADEAYYFEALGAALGALDRRTTYNQDYESAFLSRDSSFTFQQPISNFLPNVEFREWKRGNVNPEAEYILGLDVGSTTTKAVLMDKNTFEIVSSCYLRTNGDPIGASKKCYATIADEINISANVIAIGVTGSGRMIAGLHAQTKIIINEILAHARAAAYFDPEVDTIFEIGGQDAKYTYLTSGVPSDYAMNEACSAGTGSFLEEAAYESLKVQMTDIAEIAMDAKTPPNFNTQCAAFIGSDIKTAIQEGIDKDDIVAGLVYSICQNYLTRVKGNRPVGKKIFMQGGVCYNRAIPPAMSAIIKRPIIVPPEPGLMGAFGVAMVAKEHLDRGTDHSGEFDLKKLACREVTYGKTFNCKADGDNCRLNCPINIIEVEGKKFPFGGACSRYSNQLMHEGKTEPGIDYIGIRENNLIGDEVVGHEKNKPKIGILKSLLTNSMYPLYREFFSDLGMEPVLIRTSDAEGSKKKRSSFCYPVEIAHGFVQSFINLNIDYLFLPHIKGIESDQDSTKPSVICPLAQGEPYYLKNTFTDLNDKKVLVPVLDFSQGFEANRKQFVKVAESLGYTKAKASSSFDKAVFAFKEYNKKIKAEGLEALAYLKNNPDKIGIVVFGRSYNALASEANMAIPRKFSSRGYVVIPVDGLPVNLDDSAQDDMYWGTGRIILKGAEFIKNNPQIYPVYVTNFSCGPDAFIISYFRDIMGKKPSLTLELDSHTADAGIDTRIEAFLDIIDGYRNAQGIEKTSNNNDNLPYLSFDKKNIYFVKPDGSKLDVRKENIKILIPAMGYRSAEFMAAALRYIGLKATGLPAPTEKDAENGRLLCTSKECLPFILTVGNLVDYLGQHSKDDNFIYFMPKTSGPCRFGQYNRLTETILKRNNIQNVAMLSLSSENSYGGLPPTFMIRAWVGMILNDIFDDIYNTLMVAATNKEEAFHKYNRIYQNVIDSISKDSWKDFWKKIKLSARQLSDIEVIEDFANLPKIGLIGEIYVRRDDFSRQYLAHRFAEKNIITKVAPVHEWVYYCDYLMKNRISKGSTRGNRIKGDIITIFKKNYEKRLMEMFAATGLFIYEPVDIPKLLDYAKKYMSEELTGEGILTVGSSLHEIEHNVDGVIIIGPFGCMPTRIAEAILSKELAGKPFLAIESDGNVFPPIIEAKLESFLLQVERRHKETQKKRK